MTAFREITKDEQLIIAKALHCAAKAIRVLQPSDLEDAWKMEAVLAVRFPAQWELLRERERVIEEYATGARTA